MSCTLEDNLKRLDMISELQSDWNGYGAEPIDPAAIERTKRIIFKMDVQPDVFPLATNGVQIEWEFSNGWYLEFEIYNDKIKTFYLYNCDYDNAVSKVLKSDEELLKIYMEISCK